MQAKKTGCIVNYVEYRIVDNNKLFSASKIFKSLRPKRRITVKTVILLECFSSAIFLFIIQSPLFVLQ